MTELSAMMCGEIEGGFLTVDLEVRRRPLRLQRLIRKGPLSDPMPGLPIRDVFSR